MASSSPPPRKKAVAPPCWSHDETLSLIESYRDKWYSLRRGNLRSPDWDAVAAAVSRRCAHVSPPKTAVQCRNKIEKLRQRYRAEKRRSLSYYVSPSWVFFPLMDSMENGPSSAAGSDAEANSGDGIRPKPLIDRNAGGGSGSYGNNSGNPSQRFDLDRDAGNGFHIKTFSDLNMATVASARKKSRKFGSSFGDDSEGTVGFCGKNLTGRSLVPSGLKSKSYGITDGDYYDPDVDFDHHRNFDKKRLVPDFSSQGQKPKLEPRILNGCSSPASGRGGGKREMSPLWEMVSAIKSMGEGFVKVEKMKMEMAREMEIMKMEMEMERVEMLIKSQKQMVDAFVTGIL